MNLLKIFLSATLQIFLVSVNTYLISHSFVLEAGIVGFLLSLVWSYNIRKIVISSTSERLVYCLGAGVGTSLGVLLMKILK